MKWLKSFDLVAVLSNCHSSLQQKIEFAQLVTNMTMLNKPELQTLSLDYFQSILDSQILEIMMENFVKN